MGKEVFYVAQATPIQRAEAHEIYMEMMQKTRFDDMLTDEAMCQQLMDSDLWTEKQQKALDDGPKVLEQLKVQLYQAHRKFQSKHVRLIRKQLDKTRKGLNKLHNMRHTKDVMTCEGLAEIAKVEHLVYSGAKNVSDNPRLLDDSDTLKKVTAQFLQARVPERILREIARTEPWRGLWSVSKAEGSLLGIPAVMVTEDQKALVVWSRIYDSVYESMDCPGEPIIRDNDLLDGWLTVQHRKREAERKKREGDEHASKVKNAQEVFIPVQSAEDARRVEALNDQRAKLLKAQRSKALEKRGTIREQDMPDSQLKLRAQAMAEARAAAKKK